VRQVAVVVVYRAYSYLTVSRRRGVKGKGGERYVVRSNGTGLWHVARGLWVVGFVY